MMNNKHKFIILFLILAFVPLILGAKKDVASSPVKVQADEMRYYGTERKSTFHGNVVAVSDNYTLTADNVTVLLDKKNEISKIKCVGNVNFRSDDVISISKQADLDQKKKVAVITGNVKVWQGENYLEGEKVYIYYEEERIIVDKGTDKRVTIIFKPTDEGKK